MHTVVENKSLQSIKVEATKDNNVELFYPGGDAEDVSVSGLLTDAITSLRNAKEVIGIYMGNETVCEEAYEESTCDIAEKAMMHLNEAAFCLSSLMGSEILKTMYYGKDVETKLTEEEYCERFGAPEDHAQGS